MKTQIVLLRITVAASILFLAFHLAFYRMLDWTHTLECLSSDNRGILITYHFMSLALFTFMSVLFLFQAKTLLVSKLKYSVLPLFAIIFLIRIVTEFTHFGFTSAMSYIIIIVCLLPVVASIAGLFNPKQ